MPSWSSSICAASHDTRGRSSAAAARRRCEPAGGSNPAFTIAEFGFASATHELNKTIDKDFKKAEYLSVPITFLILLFAFGAFVAAGVPVLLAFSAVLGSIGLAALASHVVPRLRCDAVGDPPDGDGRRGRLLALLPQA